MASQDFAAVACACCFDFRCRRQKREAADGSGLRRAAGCVPFGRRLQYRCCCCGASRDSHVAWRRHGDAADHFLPRGKIYPSCETAVGAAAAAEVVVTVVAAVDGAAACGQLCPSWTAAAGDTISVFVPSY